MKRIITSLTFAVILISASVFGLSGCHSHTAEIDAEVPATCHSEGKTEGSHCSECGEVIVEQTVIPMIEHTPVTDNAVEASCSAEGKTEGSHCSVCDEILVAQEVVEKLPHQVIIDPAVAATCISEGSTEGIICSVCNEVVKEKTVLPKTDHTVVTDPAVAATCSSYGYTESSYCSVCNEVFKAQETLEKLEHTRIQIPKVEATCTTEGKTAITKCSVCDEFLGGGLPLATQPHTPVEIPGKAATCTTVGLSTGYSCSVCNKLVTTQKETPKLPHSFSGNKCTVCGYEKSVSSTDTSETGLTLQKLLTKDISILKYFTPYTGSSIYLGFKDISMSDAKTYVTDSDVLGYPCKIYVFTDLNSKSIYGIYCYAEMGTLSRESILPAETVTNHTNKTMNALNSIFNTINNNANVTIESVEDVLGIFAPSPIINKIQYSDIYDKIYGRYPTGFVCEGGIIRIIGEMTSGQYSSFVYNLYIAQYSTDGGWNIHGNCIVLEF